MNFKIYVLDIVGWEGVWGVLISFVFISILYIIPGHFILMLGEDFRSFENPFQSILQVFHNFVLFLSISTSILVIGPFNYHSSI